ncbi:hypothetical protein H0H87_000991 [Tephrocybe sp. NHM501043]|nr:hypothetical protein H0H87_000991 [Tephrocybe sp. NHM501043]
MALLFGLDNSNTVGNIASVASVDWGLAVQIMAAASIGSNQTFTATTGQTLYAPCFTLDAPDMHLTYYTVLFS